ncbi:MAG TPA: glycosyltransferase [Pirellula sp.]|nr:glycosyltransferase [Pirellula sp.]
MTTCKLDYSVTFACYNQVDYTRKCIESMATHGIPLERLVVFDNGSTDATQHYLHSLPLGQRIFNQANLGCGVAWNQGALAMQTEWTIVMNNDAIVSHGWIESLIGTAISRGLKVVSPSLIEGPLDYDFDAFASMSSEKMKRALRVSDRHAVCMAIHKSVWLEVGYFRATPRLLGYEDTLFFHELEKARVPLGMTGASWIHHFGSMTLTAIKLERGLRIKDGIGDRHNYRLLEQSWLKRKFSKISRLRRAKKWRVEELNHFGMTMHGLRKNGRFVWLG